MIEGIYLRSPYVAQAFVHGDALKVKILLFLNHQMTKVFPRLHFYFNNPGCYNWKKDYFCLSIQITVLHCCNNCPKTGRDSKLGNPKEDAG
jgi:hypothetical protein